MTKNIFLIRNTLPNNYGGAESYQIDLAKILKEHNYEPVIVSSSRKLLQNAAKQQIKTIKAPFLKQQNWSGWRNVLLPVYLLWQLKLYFWYKKQFKKYQPIAVDVQSRDDWIAATLAAKRLKIKIFWTDHIDLRIWVFQNINSKYKNFIGKYILSLMNIPKQIFMISNFEKRWLEKTTYPAKLQNVTVLTNGSIDRKELYSDIKPTPKSFCYVGRIINYKGIEELIKAFNLVSQKQENAILNIYGNGPDYKQYLNAAKPNKNIIFHGHTDDPLRAISESEIFVLPSYYEGMSISLLDASMLGKPIIATRIDGNTEIITDRKTGLLVEAKNHKSLSSAMEKIISDKKLQTTLGVHARKNYEKNFDFRKTVEEIFLPLL